MEQPLCDGRCHQCAHRERSRALAKDGHVFGIATEGGNIAVYPLQSRNLIEQAVVPGGFLVRLGGQFFEREKSENSQAIVHGNDDHTLPRKHPAVLPWLGGCAGHESSSVNPDHHREFGFGILCRRPDVQVQAILVDAWVAKNHVGVDPPLHTA